MIYINGKFINQKITGVQRFANEISKLLISNFGNYKIIIPKNIKINMTDYPFEKVEYFGHGNLNHWEQIQLPLFLKMNNSPLLLTFTGLGPIFYKNKIITIHDLSFWEHPEWFSKKYAFAYRFFTPISLKNSIKLFTVSEYSKQTITKELKCTRSDIEVIYNAVNEYICEDRNIKKVKYILAVGSIDPRKNLDRLISSFQKWNNHDYELIIIGGHQKSFPKINLSTKANVKFLGYVSEELLHKYYSESEIFIYPSLYEGFGIPPLEAMAHGTPVIASNITSLPEACGEAALYIDPYSEESIINAFELLSKNSRLQKELIIKGFENLKRFSWSKSALKINEIIKNL